MIINIRGTSGSGKTHIVRRIMELYGTKVNVMVEGRRKPQGYILSGGPPGRTLAVLGHYETACGGCDTLPTRDLMFELVRSAHADGHDVLFEGLMLGGEVNRTVALHADGLPLTVINLTTDMELCLDSVRDRREARGNMKPLDPKNTVNKKREVDRASDRCVTGGVDLKALDREEAFQLTKALLGL